MRIIITSKDDARFLALKTFENIMDALKVGELEWRMVQRHQ